MQVQFRGSRETTISRRLATVSVFVIAAGLLSACAGNPAANPGQEVTIDVGTKKITTDSDAQTKIAYFVEDANNSAVAGSVAAAQAMAEKLGAKIDVFSAGFDAVTQDNQMQNALNRDYNAWVVNAVDGTLACPTVTDADASKNIVVAVVNLPVCGRAGNSGDDLWAPGTLTYAGGNERPESFKRVMERAVEENPGPQKVGVLTGPELYPITQNFDVALAQIRKKYPEFEIVQVARTDYSTPQAQEKAVAMLQANPDLTVILTAFSNLSRGAVTALQADGKAPGDVNIYEAGGTKWAVQALEEGWISVTTAFFRPTNSETGVEAVVKARKGEPVPRVNLNDGHALLPDQKEDETFLLDRENVSTSGYEPTID